MESFLNFVQRHAVLLAGVLGILATLIGVGRYLYKVNASMEAAEAASLRAEAASRERAGAHIAPKRRNDDPKSRKTECSGSHGSGGGSDE